MERRLVRQWEDNGDTVTVLAEQDVVEVFVEDVHGSAYAFSLSPRTALSVVLFLLRWWVTVTWCGMRTWWLLRQARIHAERRARLEAGTARE